MTVRFVSQDLEWTDSMKQIVQDKLVKPIRRFLKNDNFELSAHLALGRKRMGNRKPMYEFWIVLQTFDRLGNQVVRREGNDFIPLVLETASVMRAQLRKERNRLKTFNPFKLRWLESSL